MIKSGKQEEFYQALSSASVNTPLGPMIAIGDDKALYLLEFVDRRGLENEIKRLRDKIKVPIIPGRSKTIKSIELELEKYFSGELETFKTNISMLGTPFQKNVWQELQKIPSGKTISYAQLAVGVGNPAACRAVARANGTNQLSLIIPCHRVINSDGELGGYGGGISRKKWLLYHEQKVKK